MKKLRYSRIPGWVVSTGLMGRLSPSAVKLLCAIGYHSNESEGHRSWAKRGTLLAESGLSLTSYKKAKTEIVRAGILAFSKNEDGKGMNFWIADAAPMTFGTNIMKQEFARYRAFMANKKALSSCTKKSPQKGPKLNKEQGQKLAPKKAKDFDPPKIIGFVCNSSIIPQKNEGEHRRNIEEQRRGYYVTSEFQGPSAPAIRPHPSSVAAKATATTPGKEEAGQGLRLEDFEAGEKSSMLDTTGKSSMLDIQKESAAPDAPPLKKRGRPLADRDSPAAQLLGYHCLNFEKVMGFKYMPEFARDLRHAKSMLAVHSMERLREMNDVFFKIKDPFIQNVGFTFGLFRQNINKLASRIRKDRPTGKSQYRREEIRIGTRKLTHDLDYEQVFSEWDGEKWIMVRVPKARPLPAPLPSIKPIDPNDEFE